MAKVGDQPQVMQDFNNKVLPAIDGMQTLDAAVASAVSQAPDVMQNEGIATSADFINWMTNQLTWVPQETTQSTEVLEKLCTFYFIFDTPPLYAYQTQVEPNSVGNTLTTLSSWLVEYAQNTGAFLDDPASLTPASFQTFNNAPLYRVWECTSPDGSAFKSFNQFFGRQLATPRAVAGQGDNGTVVYPADSKFDNCFQVDTGSNTWVPAAAGDPTDPSTLQAKGWTWSVGALLQGSKWASAFSGGVWAHSFLSAYNYHHFRAPVSGKVVDFNVIQNACYLDVVASGGQVIPRRRIRKDVGAGDAVATVTAQDQSGYQFLQTRGYYIIDTTDSPDGNIGLVAVLPIGMAVVSSIIQTVTMNQTVTKGDDIGYFQFGGSDIVVVFQAQAGITASLSSFNTTNSKDEHGNPLPYTFYGTELVMAKKATNK